MAKIDKNKIDFDKIRNTFIEMNNDKGVLGLSVLEELEFQKKTLEKMKKDIEESSLIAEYSSYKRANPIIAGYNAMIKNYATLVSKISDLLPAETQTDVSVDDLINGNY